MTLAPAGDLREGDLRLVLLERHEGRTSRWGVPAYQFRMVIGGRESGNINLRISRIKRITHFAGQVGYGVDKAYRGRGCAVRACRLLAPLARQWAENPLDHLRTDGARQKRRYRLRL